MHMQGGTATLGADFMLLNTMVTIPAGQMSTTAVLTIIADKVSYTDTGPTWPVGSIDGYSRDADELILLASRFLLAQMMEADETVILTLSTSTAAITIATATAQVVIANDDGVRPNTAYSITFPVSSVPLLV